MHTDDEGMWNSDGTDGISYFFSWEGQLGSLAPETTRAKRDGISFRNAISLMLRQICQPSRPDDGPLLLQSGTASAFAIASSAVRNHPV